MKNKLMILFCSIIFSAATVTGIDAQGIEYFMGKYLENQDKIVSLVGSGVMKITMKDSIDNTIYETESELRVYLKAPNLFKLETFSPAQSTVIQRGDSLIQSMEGMDGSMTTKVNETNDLFSNFLGRNLSGMSSQISGAESSIVEVENEELVRFRIKNLDLSNQNSPVKIDYSDLYFNSTGMLVRSETYSNGELYTQSIMKYRLSNGLYAIAYLKTIAFSDGMKIQNEITYSSMTVNGEVLDSEFEL